MGRGASSGAREADGEGQGGEGEEAEEADLERPHEQPTRKVLSARALGLYGP